MNPDIEKLKDFMMTNQLLEHDFGQIEKKFDIDLGRQLDITNQPDQDYYPQIEQGIRSEASRMSKHYEVFYSLEKSVKNLISETLESIEGEDWWSSKRINQDIKKKAQERQQKEIDYGVTPRSDEAIDFCTFGELGEIIKENWDLFGAIFISSKAVEKVMASLNTLRGPVAHCSPLADDEVLRLKLTVRDWFRLME